jgi:hypothetical protein
LKIKEEKKIALKERIDLKYYLQEVSIDELKEILIKVK